MSGDVLIVGGGLAAQRASETLRRRGHDGAIRMLCGEPVRPYDRPPLSKEILRDGTAGHDGIALRPEAWYRDHDVELLLGDPAVALDAAAREVTTASGARLRAGSVLIATGAQPRRLDLLDGYANVHHLRTLGDALALRPALRAGRHVAVVGAGFIGQEVAAAARAAGAQVTLVEALAQPLERIVGGRLGAWFAQLHREHGVEVSLGDGLEAVHGDGRVEALQLAGGRRVEVDAVVVGVGVAPAVDWLAGTALGGGPVVVDGCGRTAAPGVFAAGDATVVVDGGDVPRRCEHWEAAVRGAAAAAHGVLGLAPPPAPPSSFWSDLYGLRVQLVGHPAATDDLALHGEPDSRSFTATWSRAGCPVAALLVDRAHELPHHRRAIATGEPLAEDRTRSQGGLAA